MNARLLFCAPLALFTLLVACSSGPTDREACDHFNDVCTATGNGMSVTVTCDPDAFDRYSDPMDVKNCIMDSTTCLEAVACSQ